MPGRQLLDVVATVSRALRPAQAERLGAALAATDSAEESQHLVALIPTPAFRQNTQQLLDAWKAEPSTAGIALGAAIAAASYAHDEARRNPHLELVVSGPTSTIIHARRTEQVLLQLIAEATREILLLTFALQMHDDLREALAAAGSRGVRVTVLAEDPDDNPRFRGDPGQALADLLLRRLRWPAKERPGTGAAMHAKIVVIDEVTALITSANLTRRAAGDNLEAGVLIRGGDIPERLAGHVAQLRKENVLRALRGRP